MERSPLRNFRDGRSAFNLRFPGETRGFTEPITFDMPWGVLPNAGPPTNQSGHREMDPIFLLFVVRIRWIGGLFF